MLEPLETCYVTVPDKNARFPREFVPKMQALFRANIGSPQTLAKTITTFAEYLHLADLRPVTSPRLRFGDEGTLHRLHELVRAGKYVFDERRPCDRVQFAEQTMRAGGDCDQWAHVMFLAAWLLGFPRAWLVALGHRPPADGYMHVYVAVQGTTGVFALDPKGDQRGLPFNAEAGGFTRKEAFLWFDNDDRPGGRI